MDRLYRMPRRAKSRYNGGKGPHEVFEPDPFGSLRRADDAPGRTDPNRSLRLDSGS
jgi:hypothetical protein